MSKLSKQELHNLGMNIVGKDLEKKKYEFLAINSDLTKNPQFIVKKENEDVTFVVVKVVTYPEDPEKYDVIWMESFKKHAISKRAKLFYAGVGFANSDDMNLPLSKESGYIVKYNGLKEI
jgi:phosphoribosylamine-glycine ligase